MPITDFSCIISLGKWNVQSSKLSSYSPSSSVRVFNFVFAANLCRTSPPVTSLTSITLAALFFGVRLLAYDMPDFFFSTLGVAP